MPMAGRFDNLSIEQLRSADADARAEAAAVEAALAERLQAFCPVIIG